MTPELREKVWSMASKTVRGGGWLGMPWEEDNGCVKFIEQVFAELGIASHGGNINDAREFKRMDRSNGYVPQFGDVVVFKSLPFGGKFHIAMMLDWRWAIQSSSQTNGAGKVDITRPPYCSAIRGFFRHKQLCS